MTQSSWYSSVYHEDRSEISLHTTAADLASPCTVWCGPSIARCNDSVWSSPGRWPLLHSWRTNLVARFYQSTKRATAGKVHEDQHWRIRSHWRWYSLVWSVDCLSNFGTWKCPPHRSNRTKHNDVRLPFNTKIFKSNTDHWTLIHRIETKHPDVKSHYSWISCCRWKTKKYYISFSYLEKM